MSSYRRCARCATPLARYKGEWYCPNCTSYEPPPAVPPAVRLTCPDCGNVGLPDVDFASAADGSSVCRRCGGVVLPF
jgi:hypothetical protein